MYARVVLGVGKGVLFREVSSTQECPYRRVPLYYPSILYIHTCRRCPQFRGSVLIDRFHCIIHPYCIYIHVAGVLSSGGVSL